MLHISASLARPLYIWFIYALYFRVEYAFLEADTEVGNRRWAVKQV